MILIIKSIIRMKRVKSWLWLEKGDNEEIMEEICFFSSWVNVVLELFGMVVDGW